VSEGWKNGRWTLFKCPLCGSESYVQVRVQKPIGDWYLTEFFQCFDCSVCSKIRSYSVVAIPAGWTRTSCEDRAGLSRAQKTLSSTQLGSRR
jgi:hypothetical protein